MTLDDFLALLPSSSPVILLEGTRALPDRDRSRLVALAAMLAERLPDALFRTGNATGSDEAWAEGVARVAPARLQYVLPRESMGRERRHPVAYSVAMNEVPRAEEPEIIYRTRSASPHTAKMVEHYEQRITGSRSYAQSLYLLRDTLKVVGSAEIGLAPADVGLFYVNTDDPSRGGTGHTIRVCRELGVPVVTQSEWMGWNPPVVPLEEGGQL